MPRQRQRKLGSRSSFLPSSEKIPRSDYQYGLLPDYKTEIMFEIDTYSQLMLRLVQFCDVSCSINALQLVHALLMYVLSIFVEIVMTSFVLLGTHQMEKQVLDELARTTYNMTLAEGAELLRAVAHHDVPTSSMTEGALKLCRSQLRVGVNNITPIMIGCWIMFVFQELRSAVWFLIHLCGADTNTGSLDDGSIDLPEDHPLYGTMMRYDSEDDTVNPFRIQRITPCLRIVLLILIPLMRIVIGLTVTFAGIRFIVHQTEPLKMVLKTICMKFVFRIDELLIKSTSTATTREDLKKSRFLTSLAQPKENSTWERGVGGMVYTIIIIVVTYFATFVMFGDFMAFREGCFLYYKEYPIPGVRAWDGLMSMFMDMIGHSKKFLG